MAMLNNQRVSPLNHHGLLVKSHWIPRNPPGEAPADPIGLWEASTRARRDRGHLVKILAMGKSEMGVYVCIYIHLHVYTYEYVLYTCI